MTDFLRIQGVPVPVADGSFSARSTPVGTFQRAEDGTAVFDRRALKREWDFATALRPAAEAHAFRDLLLGKAQVWSFDSNLYSSKGLSVAGTGLSISATQKKFGATSLFRSGATDITITDQYDYTTLPWTCSFWRWTGSAWEHITENSANQRFVNGSNVGARTMLFPASTEIYLAPGTSTYVDDLCLSRFLWPASWAASVYSFNAALGPSPRLRVDGLGVEAGVSTVYALGDNDNLDLAQGWYGGSWNANLASLKITLREA